MALILNSKMTLELEANGTTTGTDVTGNFTLVTGTVVTLPNKDDQANIWGSKIVSKTHKFNSFLPIMNQFSVHI